MYKELKLLLEEKQRLLFGDFVKNNSNYDGSICEILGMSENTCRYWDAQWNGMKIEFKKGKSIWLDLIRYSEILVGENNGAKEKTFTLFFIPDKDRSKIIEIIGINSEKLINKLCLKEDVALALIKLNKDMPRSLNAQASLTVKDLREISDFIVK